MALERFEFNGKPFEINRSGKSIIVSTEDFVATDKQLDVLAQQAEGQTQLGAARKLEMSHNTIRTHMRNLKIKNEELTGIRQTTTELMLKAQEYELLYPATIEGLKSYKKNR